MRYAIILLHLIQLLLTACTDTSDSSTITDQPPNVILPGEYQEMETSLTRELKDFFAAPRSRWQDEKGFYDH